MVKISKYFSLFKFSITHPKGGVDMFNAAMQTHDDSKQKIKKHTAKSLKLENPFNSDVEYIKQFIKVTFRHKNISGKCRAS